MESAWDVNSILDAIGRGSSDNILAEAHDQRAYAHESAAIDAIEAYAREFASTPIQPLPWSLLRLFDDTGDRRRFETPFFDRRRALGALEISVLAGRDVDGTLLSSLHDFLWAICDEYSWCVPAHFHFLNRPSPIALGLFSSETGFYIAEALHVLGDKIDRRVADRCRAEIRRRILDSYLGDYPREWWEDGTNNWGAVCAGAIGITFLYEEKDKARQRTALARILATMDAFLSSFPPDGACLEGTGYWEYGFGSFVIFADFVHRFTNGAVDLFDDPRARRIASFPQTVALSPTRTASFADVSRFSDAFSPAKLALRRHYGAGIHVGATDLTPFKTSFYGTRPPCLLRTLLWSASSGTVDPLPDGAFYLPNAEWLVVRHSPFAFAALFGNNDTPHNHNDIGSFLLVSEDKEGPIDLGRGDYSGQYFSAERYTILCNGSQGHSVPIVGGEVQKAGGRYRASDVTFREEGDETVFSGEISGAYGLDTLKSLRRTFRVRPAEGITTVTDVFAFSGSPLSVTERFVGYAKVDVVAPGEARFGAFTVRFDPALKASVHTEEMPSESGGKSTVSILDVELPPGASSFEAVFAP